MRKIMTPDAVVFVTSVVGYMLVMLMDWPR